MFIKCYICTKINCVSLRFKANCQNILFIFVNFMKKKWNPAKKFAFSG